MVGELETRRLVLHIALVVALASASCGALVGSVRAEEPAAARGVDWHRSVRISTQVEQDGRYDSTQTWDVTAETAEAARSIAQQGFGFSAGLEDVTVAEAYTRKADGTRISVKPDAILHQAAGVADMSPSFSDWEPRSIVFPDVGQGDTVHYVLHWHARQALFPGHYETVANPGPAANLDRVDISITLPATRNLEISTGHLAEDAPVTHDGRVTRTWHLDRTGEGGAVWFEASTFPDYEALGAAYAARALPKAAPGPDVRALASRLTDGAKDERDRVRRLYEYVAQHIRYVALQFGQGRVVPHGADTVLHLGYGDCKDHATLLQALLTAAGTPSEPALISVKPRYDLPRVPTLAVLDHVVLHVPGLGMYLDPTSPYAPFGVLPFEDYGKPVVLARAEGSQIARVPPLSPGMAVLHVRTEAWIGDDGTVSGSTASTASGPAAIVLRGMASSIAGRDAGSAAEERLRALGTPGSGDFVVPPPLAIQESYTLAGHFRLDDRIDGAAEDRLSVPAGLAVIDRSGSFLISPSPGPGGVHVCYAGRQIEDVTLHLPAGSAVQTHPRDVSLAAGDASFQAQYDVRGDTVSVHREFAVTVRHAACSEEEWQAMRPVMAAMRRDDRAEIVLAHPAPERSPASHGFIGASYHEKAPRAGLISASLK